MVQAMVRITCPNCRRPFTAPLEQVLDVEVDPSAKARLLSGQVNFVVCPHCGAGGAVSLPFLYHDPSKELAFVFLPMEAGRTDLERQQVIGALSKAVMNQLPPEQRKSYLLNPKVFFSYDSLVKAVLEADGITEEMLEARKARSELLRKFLEAKDEEERIALIEENESLLDEDFFRILSATLLDLEAMGVQDVVQRLQEVRQLLFERTPVGRRLAARAEALQVLSDEPTREKLLDLLIQHEDPATREALLIFGQPLVDYFFFQTLTQRIEEAKDEQERERLEAIRRQAVEVRQELQEQAKQVVESKVALVRDLLETERPELLARRRLADLDELFFSVLGAEIERAQREGDQETAARLEEIWKLTMDLIRAQVPPQVTLLTRVLEAKGVEEVRRVLEENRSLVDQAFLQLLEQIGQQLREGGDAEAAERAAIALEVARPMVESGPKEEKKPPEKKPPGGLEIARR
ncbi:MAG TPA: hypothetical protein ENK08_04375 [Chloroflexi bacterium]|nr:hypothetical protein [Chloroflexota bacterium]